MRDGRGLGGAAAMLAVAVLVTGCTFGGPAELSPGGAAGPAPQVTSDPGGHAELAIISDYGGCDDGEQQVAAMVRSWNPSIVATAGDNTQGVEGCEPFTESVGGAYESFLMSPDGPKLFPVPGNHDYEDAGAGEAAYLDYFAYLGAISDTPLWYTVSTGNVNLFMLNSETDAERLTQQREWLRSALTSASEDEAAWNVVVFHRPPFTSGPHEPNVEMRPDSGWDYTQWGADLVVNGHQHVFEVLEQQGIPYVVAGVGTSGLVRPCPAELVPESQGCSEGIGAIRLTASADSLLLDYRSPDGAEGTSVRTVKIDRSE
ncbi:metallophosphoesterase family protein [Microbacterium trichothecenolyticum]